MGVEINRMLDLLEHEYGRPSVRRRPPLDELILTILSQNTSDVNRDRAYTALRERFPTWQQVLEGPVAEVEEAIRPGGLARQKAPRIKAVLEAVEAAGHGLDLGWLRRMPPGQAMDWLVGLPGVGVKTASIVLLFSFGVPVMPVDTHVHRIALRLGLIPPGTSAERAHPLLTALVPDERMLEAHLLWIEHGRRTCRARSPRCTSCPLLEGCPFGRRVVGAAA